jgi:hypothetical protein
MRVLALLTAAAALVGPDRTPAAPPADSYDRFASLAGTWEADIPGFGKLLNTIRVVSNGRAIEETIGPVGHDEVSVYTRDSARILVTHYCALTPDGHQVRLESAPLAGAPDTITFGFVGATNLHSPAAPHMRLMRLTYVDHDHFTEAWTKSENGTDTVYDLHFVRQ